MDQHHATAYYPHAFLASCLPKLKNWPKFRLCCFKGDESFVCSCADKEVFIIALIIQNNTSKAMRQSKPLDQIQRRH